MSPFQHPLTLIISVDVRDPAQKRRFRLLNILLKPSLPPRKGGASIITKVIYGSVVALAAFLTVWLKDDAMPAKLSVFGRLLQRE